MAALDPNDLKNYRPVSNLSSMSKVLETVVMHQLMSHLHLQNLLSEFQSAYRPHHSTETALVRVVSDLLSAMDNGKVSILTLLGLSAAFDTIDHDILLHCLKRFFGIQSTALSWFKSYLTDRQQIVSVNGRQYKSLQLLFGVLMVPAAF